MKITEEDNNAPERKKDHIELAFSSQVQPAELDDRFYYEPALVAHPERGSLVPLPFLGKTLRAPLWVSSMTGGTEWASTINAHLARACKDFGMGMGLGSCRALLYSDEYLKDFDIRHLIGDDQPLFANLGIAQVELLLEKKETDRIRRLIGTLRADGLIIHINPLQEWLQPEGDRFRHSPLQTIESLLPLIDFPLIVKEVGQGMGYESLKALLQLPLAAVDFAAGGGTNFAKLELLRSQPEKQLIFESLAKVGHTALEMVQLTNRIIAELGDRRRCGEVIISGGIRNFLDGYYLLQKIQLPAVYGQASGFLQYAREDYDKLYQYVDAQIQGLELAYAFLKVK